ncbi:MAG: RagB/SusD family nutrient uptake outer membrane protein [Chitinophagaceae bacterium]|nr:MAG: RagB/SusD family nutrient uptake outer membrane protein [Chitinophagaceae bacterium]
MLSYIKKPFLILSTAVVLMTGCSKEDVIELVPEFTFDGITNPSSMDQVEQVLLGAYTGFRSADYYGSGSGTGNAWGMMNDVISDNFYETIESLANSRTMADWLYNAETGQIASSYTAAYQVISRANIVLRDVDKFTTATNTKMANRIKGQALAIRALAHFDLFRYFANRYDRNSTTELAVAYMTEFAVSTAIKPTRLNNKDFYDKVLADISAALPLLADVDRAINAPGAVRPYIDANAAYALQARVYLYAGLYPEAITAATAAINNRPLTTGQAAFSGLYNQTSVNAGEIIWNVQFESNQSGPTFLAFFATNNRSYFRPAPEVVTATGTSGLIQSNDIRYSAYFTNIGGAPAITKYKGKGGLSDGNANFIVFRTGEMYLIRAEARALSSQEGLALDDLNALRAARIDGYVPVSGLTGAALLEAIANERRAELIGEGHRFFDLKRTTRTLVRGAVCGTATSVAGDCDLAPADREWAWPIPVASTRINPGMVQNPNY